MTLSALGWDDALAASFLPHSAAGLLPARVALEHKRAYQLLSSLGELEAVCTGRLAHQAAARGDFPAVGDWVACAPRAGDARRADIHAVLPRRTKFSRRAAGEREGEQIVAANIDTVFLVTALDQNYNLRRIERYLAVARESGAQPVVLLNKADLHADPARARVEVEAIAAGAPVVALSAARDASLEALAPWLAPGRTVALLGSSGVGKSTLINRLLGRAQQRTATLSEAAGKGRHTTTQRELLLTPGGALVIDTPGMRELQLWAVGAPVLDATFAEVAALAARCRFHDCTHGVEPGCAVQAALDAGTLDAARWASFQKLQREQAYAARRDDPRLERENKAHWKKLHRAVRAMQRMERADE
jgi:ribosome biogenesis GTPase